MFRAQGLRVRAQAGRLIGMVPQKRVVISASQRLGGDQGLISEDWGEVEDFVVGGRVGH